MREKRFALSLGLPEDSTGDCARVTLVGQSGARGRPARRDRVDGKPRAPEDGPRRAERAGRRAAPAGAVRRCRTD